MREVGIREDRRTSDVEFWHSAFRAASDAIAMTDLEAVLMGVNPAFEIVTGYSAEEVIGRNVGHVIGTEYNRGIYPAMWQALTDSGYWAGQFINRRKNGEQWISDQKISLVTDVDGRPLGYVSVARDVTEQRRAEDQLKHYVRSLEQAHAEVEQGLEANTFALARACEYREGVTGRHLHRMQALCQALAAKLGYTRWQTQRLGLAAVLHDLGKIGVPEAILTKPGSLTEEEWVVMRQHPIIGLEILPPLSYFQMARQIVRSHHENFDGTGYPDGLAGTDIPLPARIVRVADTFDAMVSERPYKPARPPEAAMEEIQRLAGKQFCPAVVEAFKALWEDGILAGILSGEKSGDGHREPAAP